MGCRQVALKNRDERLEYQRKWYRENKERHLERGREWNRRNPEKVREANRKWRVNNPDYKAAWRASRSETDKRAQSLATRYGFGMARARELLTSLPEGCEICGAKEKLCYDHCHASGEHRGWLCDRCNTGLGNFRDTPEFLKLAAAYLEERG